MRQLAAAFNLVLAKPVVEYLEELLALLTDQRVKLPETLRR